MYAENILGIVASEEFSEGLQLIRSNLRLPTIIFQVIVPELDREDQPRAKLRSGK